MRRRLQEGQYVVIGQNWYIRYWETRNQSGTLVRKRVTKFLAPAIGRAVKNPPAEIVTLGVKHMITVNAPAIRAERVLTMGDFVDTVYWPFIERRLKPSTLMSYRTIWNTHLKPHCAKVWLRDVKCCDVQNWLWKIGTEVKAHNSQLHIKGLLSAIFAHARQSGCFNEANPVRDTKTDPHAVEPAETHAYSIEEEFDLLAILPQLAATAFAIACFAGLRIGEIGGLQWEDYRDNQLFISRSLWHGRIGNCKNKNSRAAVRVIDQLKQRLDMWKLACGSPQSGPMFKNVKTGKPMDLTRLPETTIQPLLQRCVHCGKAKGMAHAAADHVFEQDPTLPKWYGWHSCRRALGSNLNRLGINRYVIAKILRHGDVTTTEKYYTKTNSSDQDMAMDTYENSLETQQKTNPKTGQDSDRTVVN